MANCVCSADAMVLAKLEALEPDSKERVCSTFVLMPGEDVVLLPELIDIVWSVESVPARRLSAPVLEMEDDNCSAETVAVETSQTTKDFVVSEFVISESEEDDIIEDETGDVGKVEIELCGMDDPRFDEGKLLMLEADAV